MHELPVIKEVLEVALKYAEEEHADRISKITLAIGEMHDLIPEWVKKFFVFAGKGTMAQDAVLEIKQLPIICQCHCCKEHFKLNKFAPQPWSCSTCQSEGFSILSGREFIIEKIEIVIAEE